MSLIAAANDAGGRDNITVVLFRLEAVDPAGGTRTGALTRQHDTAELPLERTSGRPRWGRATRPPRRRRGSTSDHRRPRRAPRTSSRDAGEEAHTASLTTVRPRPPFDPDARSRTPGEARPPGGPRPAPRRRRRRRLRVGVGAVLIFFFAVILVVAAWIASRAVYFVGTDPSARGAVTIYRGLPYELPAGIRLYERYAGSGVTIDAVPPSRRGVFTEHKLRSKDDAENLVIALERGQLER